MPPPITGQTRIALPDPALHPEFYENVPMKRLIAWGMDAVTIFALCLVLLPFTAFSGLFFWPVYLLTVGFFYRVGSLAAFSATPGMWLTSIRIYDHRGHRLDRMTAFLHTAGYTLSMAAVMPQVVSATLMLVTPRHQGLTDMILGTAALNRPSRNR